MAWTDHVVTTLILIAIGGLVFVTATGATVDVDLGGDSPAAQAESDETDPETETDASEQEPRDQTSGFNESAVEMAFRAELNEWRSSNGLGVVDRSDRLQPIAADQAANMLEHSYVGHTQPSGESSAERYQEFGVACEIEVPDEDYHYDSAEIVTDWYWQRETRVEWHPSGTFTATTNEELGRALFETWRASPEHREIMALEGASEVALDVELALDGTVYAAAEFC